MHIFKSISKTVHILALTMVAIGMNSCAEEVFDRPLGGIDTSEGNISILYEVEGDIPLTRGIAATEHEMNLKDVYILYFDNDKDPDNFGKFTGYTRTSATDPTTLRFDPPESVLDDHDYRLLVVGNADAYTENGIDKLSSRLDAMLATADKTYDIAEVQKNLLAYSADEVTSEKPGVLPMCGRFVSQTEDQEKIFRIKRSPEGMKIPENCIFRFQRAICRIDIHNLVGDVLDIKYVRLVNTRDHGAFFFDGMNQGNFHDLTFTSDEVNSAYIEMPEDAQTESGTTGKLQRLEAEMYCFPNTRNTCLPNDTETTAILIAGYYIEPDTHEKDSKLTYYRFNLSNAGDAQTLQRNFCYRATIKGVRQRGYDTEEKAYNATSPIFTYDISEEWDTDDDNVVTDQYGNFLVVSKSLLTFSGDQCGADVVKLTVNVSENMTWELQMADEETRTWFQAEPIIGAESETIKAFTCGPKEENHSQFYREGKLIIIATNLKTGSELRKEVRLVQLTTNGDVKCLIVNDYMSDFDQEVSKYGQTISYKVITGNPTNMWKAKDVDGKANSFGSDIINFTESGTNGNHFTITFPANISEERSIRIKFEFDCGIAEENSKIKPIYVTFHQDKCEQPLTIENWPADGELTLNCFDTTTGWQTANGVAQSRKFTVHLQKPEEHYFTVTSTFDKYRDLTLNDCNGLYGLGHEYKSVHPGNYAFFSGTAKDTYSESHYNDILDDRTSSNPSFFINAFRMGPGDPTIDGIITVEVKDKNNPDAIIPNGKLSLTVKLTVPSDEYMLNDIMIRNPDNGWIYIMDRNIGCDARMNKIDSQVFPNKAMWCHIEQTLYPQYDTGWKITNTTNDAKWLGHSPLEFPFINTNPSHIDKSLTKYITQWRNELKLYHNHLGEMYEKADEYPWMPTNIYISDALKNNICVSKSRYFILTDPQLCPINTNTKKKIRVACWLPSGCPVGYINMGKSKKLDGTVIALYCGRNVTEANFCGVSTHMDARFVAELVRLSYMIGHKTLDEEWTLPESKINDQIKYYKEHILQCYGTVKFE
ncbi:MAG: hypothetical protein K2K25_09750 [Muribaculaceae bacterium]|nr:hypothetical protein [Muribaculaceae bacterium]